MAGTTAEAGFGSLRHASWALVEHGLAVEREPDAIARTVELVVADLRKQVRK